MPNNPAFSQRSGMNKFLILARALCVGVSVSAPAIRARYPSRTALLAVLTAAESVCDLLPAAMAEQAVADSLDAADFFIDDADVIPGQDA